MLIALQLTATPQGPLSGEPVRSFDAEQLTIGRAPNCNMVLPDGLRIISRHHARLTQQAGKVRLTCLSASAPVRVNETSVPHGGALALRSGDVIHIGGFELRFAADVDEPVAMEPTAAPVASVAAVVARSPAAPPAAIAPPAVAPLPVPVPAADLPPPRPARARLDEWFDLEPAVPAGPADAPEAAVDLDLRTDAHAQRRLLGTELRVFESLRQVLSPKPEVAPEPVAAAALGPSASDASAAEAELLPLNDEARNALMLAFLEGAGLSQSTGATSTQMLAPMALTPAWMRHVGELLRASVEGALALLHSRSTVKREMRAEVTVIARRQNNPLKFAPDALAALAHLVAAKRSPGFLDPVAALKDAHEDLLVHHLAVVAGMRAAMFELIARLGPEDVLREEGPPKGLGGTLPALHEAALWRRYRQRHAEMTARLDDDFETVFGREFTKAYEAQARRVREQTSPGDPTP